MLNVKSNFTDQYLLILTLGLTNNIFLLHECTTVFSGTKCTVYLDRGSLFCRHHHYPGIWQHWFTPCCEFSHCLWSCTSLSYHTQDRALNGGDGVTGEKIIDLQGYREGRGGCIFYCVLRGKTKYSHIIIAIKFLLSYLCKEILKYRQYMYTLFCMLCQ